MISARIGFSRVGTLLSLLRKAPKTTEEIASDNTNWLSGTKTRHDFSVTKDR